MLTPRLNCIIKYVNCRIAADIGTDHAYVPIELINSKRAEKVIAADVRKGPLDIASSNIEKHGLSDRIDTKLGSGLSVLEPGEADTIIIAGMGGMLIGDIIEKDEDTARRSLLILQPMNSQYELRRRLISNNFKILHEDIECEEHHVYNIIIAESGRQEAFSKDIDYHIPPVLYENEKFGELYNKKKREFLKIINGLERSENADTEKLEYYKKAYDELKELERYVG